MTATILGQQYIGGRRSAAGPASLESRSAVGNEIHPVRFHEATAEEVDQAAQSAGDAFAVFSKLAAAKRADFLDTIAEEIDSLGDDFIAEVRRETALGEQRLQGERGRTSGQLRLFASRLRQGLFNAARIDRALPDRKPMPRVDIRQYWVAIGPVAVFGASNFPLAFSVAGGDTASALAAGCPVVVKAHPAHPVTSEHVADAIMRAAERTGMPPGTFNMVHGGREVSARLVKAPPIKAVGFTGSLQGGRALFDIAAARPDPIPVFAEMSSINPVVLMPGAVRARGAEIAKQLAGSVTLGCGQFCTKPGLVIMLRSPESAAFLEGLRNAIAEVAPQPMLHEGIHANYQEGIRRLTETEGVDVGDARDDKTLGAPRLVTADKRVLLQGEVLQEEVFGPVTVVVEVESEDELLAAADRVHGQLTATLIAEPEEVAARQTLVEHLERRAGRLIFNGYPTGVEVCDAMVHGGPYPATTDSRMTSVGTLAAARFLRPVCFQNWPENCLPEALRNSNPLGLLRLVDGEYTRDPVTP